MIGDEFKELSKIFKDRLEQLDGAIDELRDTAVRISYGVDGWEEINEDIDRLELIADEVRKVVENFVGNEKKARRWANKTKKMIENDKLPPAGCRLEDTGDFWIPVPDKKS